MYCGCFLTVLGRVILVIETLILLSIVEGIIILGLLYFLAVCAICITFLYKNRKNFFAKKENPLLPNNDFVEFFPQKIKNIGYSAKGIYPIKTISSVFTVNKNLNTKIASSGLKVYHEAAPIIRSKSIGRYKFISNPDYFVKNLPIDGQYDVQISRKLPNTFKEGFINRFISYSISQKDTIMSLAIGLFVMPYEHSELPFCIMASLTRLVMFIIHLFSVY